MATAKALIAMADYGHDPTGMLSSDTSANYMIEFLHVLTAARNCRPICGFQESWVRSPICDREWKGARV
jgi:hypothetical protein